MYQMVSGGTGTQPGDKEHNPASVFRPGRLDATGASG